MQTSASVEQNGGILQANVVEGTLADTQAPPSDPPPATTATLSPAPTCPACTCSQQLNLAGGVQLAASGTQWHPVAPSGTQAANSAAVSQVNAISGERGPVPHPF